MYPIQSHRTADKDSQGKSCHSLLETLEARYVSEFRIFQISKGNSVPVLYTLQHPPLHEMRIPTKRVTSHTV